MVIKLNVFRKKYVWGMIYKETQITISDFCDFWTLFIKIKKNISVV